MLLLRNVERTFDKNENKVTALADISMEIKKGDLVSITGPSGSGKSTLLHIIGCLDRPTKGSYTIDGMDVSERTVRELAKFRNEKFGFVLQQFALIEEETALENVTVPLMFSNKRMFIMDDVAEKMLKTLDIQELADKKVKKLSGGEKQRVAIARALVNNPDIILADEPTGSLDSRNTQLIMDLFVKLNSEGKTVIIITHDPDVAARCTSQYSIKDGKIYSGVCKG